MKARGELSRMILANFLGFRKDSSDDDYPYGWPDHEPDSPPKVKKQRVYKPWKFKRKTVFEEDPDEEVVVYEKKRHKTTIT